MLGTSKSVLFAAIFFVAAVNSVLGQAVIDLRSWEPFRSDGRVFLSYRNKGICKK